MQSRVISCPLCGSKTVTDLRFCRQCGASLEAVVHALMLDAGTARSAGRESARTSGGTNELAALITASVAFVVYVVAVFVIGLGLAAAGKLGSAATLMWIGALVAPSLVLCYFWIRRWTRARTDTRATPRTDQTNAGATTRIDFEDGAPTVRPLATARDVVDISAAQVVSETDVTKRLPDDREHQDGPN